MTPNPTERRRTTDELFELTLRRGRTLRRRRRLAVGGVGALALAGLVPVTIAVIDRDDPDRLVVADGTEGGEAAPLTTDPTLQATTTSPAPPTSLQVGPDPWFTYTRLHPSLGDAVTFTDTSNGEHTSWAWDFGDGATAEGQTVTHHYELAGTYAVRLTVAGPDGTAYAVRTVEVLPDGVSPPDVMDARPDGAPMSVTVPDVVGRSAAGADSAIAAAGLDPDVGYIGRPEAVDDGLIVWQSFEPGSTQPAGAILSVAVAATTDQVPVARFTYTPTAPDSGTPVEFTDTSSGLVTSRLWDFGDGTTSVARNPTHAFTDAGAHPVTLRVTGPLGTSNSRLTISVASPPASTDVAVPAVTGLIADSAQNRISQAGFAPFVIFQDLPAGSADIGRVLSQDPAAGTQLPAGGAVTIVVGRVGG